MRNIYIVCVCVDTQLYMLYIYIFTYVYIFARRHASLMKLYSVNFAGTNVKSQNIRSCEKSPIYRYALASNRKFLSRVNENVFGYLIRIACVEKLKNFIRVNQIARLLVYGEFHAGFPHKFCGGNIELYFYLKSRFLRKILRKTPSYRILNLRDILE